MNVVKKCLELAKKHKLVLTALLFAMLPLICCIVTCAVQGYGISDVYLPASKWNDEMFYYKQAEGVLRFGYPYGYFGFNESHAEYLSFAAWSPVLLVPWLVFGIIFGWGLLSPIYCNILLLSLAVFGFVMIARPSRRQLGLLAFLFIMFPLFTRYMLSGMPEITCFSLLILFYAISRRHMEKERVWSLVLLFVISAVLTLMRPYLILFMLLPMYFWIRKKKRVGLAGSAACMGVTGAVYFAIKHYLGAEYFAPLFDTKWITTFFDQGLLAGIKNIFRTLYYAGKSFYGYTVEGFRSGLAAGAFFGGFLAVLSVLVIQTISDIRKKRTSQAILNGHLAFCLIGMLGALLLMYKMEEGSKHMLTFIAVGIFAIAMMETRYYKKAVFVGVIFAYLFTFKANTPYDYQVPFANEEQKEMIAYWEETFTDQLVLNKSEKPGYDNVIIWTLSDTVTDGQEYTSKAFEWQLLYALPEGFGISCCDDYFLLNEFDSLQSRYIAVPTGGGVEKLCLAAGYPQIGEYAGMAVYARY